MPKNITIKRIYEPVEQDDGARVLVDRIWPRGITKAEAALDLWLKEVAPSTELRKWFGHDPERWQAFQERYDGELDRNEANVARLRGLTAKGAVTLLYSARDAAHNQAVALRNYLDRR